MKFTVKCLENGVEYTEENFDELYDIYVDDEIEDDSVELETVTAELSNDDYQNSEVCSMEDIASVADMQDLIDVLTDIENLSRHDDAKLEAICDYEGFATESLVDLYNRIDDYEFYEDTTLEDLADEFCAEGYFGDAVQEVYDEHSWYLDMEAIAKDLSYAYTEVSNGVIHSI